MPCCTSHHRAWKDRINRSESPSCLYSAPVAEFECIRHCFQRISKSTKKVLCNEWKTISLILLIEFHSKIAQRQSTDKLIVFTSIYQTTTVGHFMYLVLRWPFSLFDVSIVSRLVGRLLMRSGRAWICIWQVIPSFVNCKYVVFQSQQCLN